MYSNGDYPFKMGTYMGCDAMGNRYYENTVDYPIGQHRWIEPADIHNFDSTHIPPEWHGWMSSMNDCTPALEQEFMEDMHKRQIQLEESDAPYRDGVGHQEPYFNYNSQHNQSQIRSRGYGIGNHVVGLPPGAPDAFYTQPGSPYNPASMRKLEFVGDLDSSTGGGRPYKNDMWKERLTTEADRAAIAQEQEDKQQVLAEKAKAQVQLTPREQAILARGGTLTK